jgi:hypothetical protein
MRRFRTGFSCLVLLAGIAAIMASGVGSASAAVCGIRGDGPANYDNPQAAAAAGARVMHPGSCQSVTCVGWFSETGLLNGGAICATDPLTQEMMTYPNVCAEEHAMATFLHYGPCR